MSKPNVQISPKKRKDVLKKIGVHKMYTRLKYPNQFKSPKTRETVAKMDRKKSNAKNEQKLVKSRSETRPIRVRKGAKRGQKTSENVLEKLITTQPRVDDNTKINKCHKKT